VDNIFAQFAIILSVSSLLGLVALKLKLPLIVSYLLAGVAIASFKFFSVGDSFILETLPDIGIAFLLFLTGMELDLKELNTLGKPIIVSSLGQIILTTFLGFEIAKVLGFGFGESVFLGLGLAFSSTVVVVKMLLEKRDLTSLYGKLSLGILLLEDVVAIAVLMFISVSNSTFNFGFQQSFPIVTLILKAIGVFILAFGLSKFFLQKLFSVVAKSTELLFFTAITWCFLFTAVAALAGFSIEIGAFIAGLAIASSPYHLEIQGKIKPLRDFFITLFFIYLGSQVRLDYLISGLPVIIIFSFVAMVGKPVVYAILLSFFGFKKHTLYQVSLNLSQISEFSLIVLVVGAGYGIISAPAISIMATVGVITIISSSIFISHSRRFYKFVKPLVGILETKGKAHALEGKLEEQMDDHVLIIGAHRIGGPIARFLKREGIPFYIMDFNPHIVSELKEKGMNVIYGDIGDPEVLESLNLKRTRLIISTAPSLEDNEILIAEVKKQKSDAKIIVRAEDESHGELLKKLGADYVILPEKVSGEHIVDQIKTHWPKIIFSGLD